MLKIMSQWVNGQEDYLHNLITRFKNVHIHIDYSFKIYPCKCYK
jgi:hypothetical protein